MGLILNRKNTEPGQEQRSEYWLDQVFSRNRPYTGLGVRVDAATALTHSAVYACVDLIADMVSTFPVHRYKDGPKGANGIPQGKIPIPKLPLTIIEDPSEKFDDVNWRRILVVSWLLRGYGAGIVTQNKIYRRRPTPEHIELIHPDRVTFHRERPDSPIKYQLDGEAMDLWPRGKLWIGNGKMMNPEDPVGRSVIEFAAADIGLGISARKFGSNWFGNGGHPTAFLHNESKISDLPEGVTPADAAARIRERFMAALQTGEPVVMANGWKYESIQIKPDESQFLTTINANRVLICNFFRVPPSVLGAATGEEGMTYTNMEDKGLDLLKFTIQPWVTRMEKVLGTLTPENEYVKLNLDSLLRASTNDRYDAYAKAVKTGWATNNWVRDKEDLEPEDGLDQYLWPPNRSNMSLEEMAGDPDEGLNEPITPPTILDTEDEDDEEAEKLAKEAKPPAVQPTKKAKPKAKVKTKEEE